MVFYKYFAFYCIYVMEGEATMKSESLDVLWQVCLNKGIEECVICAGARNIPILESLERIEDQGKLRVFSHFEERDAGFFALGRTMESNAPCAVVTTSGTAVGELLPAVIEAHYQGRPLVLITADRPRYFRGSGAPQAIEQEGIFGEYVEGSDDVASGDSVCLLDTWSGQKPWHINLCIDLEKRENPLDCAIKEGARQAIVRPSVQDLALFLREKGDSLLVVVGGLDLWEREEVYYFLEKTGLPCVADGASGLREMLGNQVLIAPQKRLACQAPEAILRLGSVPVERFWRDLEQNEDIDVFSVHRSGYSGLARPSRCIEGRVDQVLRSLGSGAKIHSRMDWLTHQKKDRAYQEELLERYPESEPALMRAFSSMASLSQAVYLANSSVVRLWGEFGQREVPYPCVQAARGANGIDGQIAHWLGATAHREDAWGLFGDLTSLYSLSAPALLSQVESRGRVLGILNNGGGRLFERLPLFSALSKKTRQRVVHTCQVDFSHWAALWGMKYAMVHSFSDFDILEEHLGAEVPLMLSLIPNREQTQLFWEAHQKIF